MEKLFEAILMATMPEKLKKDAKKPIILNFTKEEGLTGEVTTTIIGTDSGVCAGLCTLLSDALKTMAPDDVSRQKKILDTINERACAELGIR